MADHTCLEIHRQFMERVAPILHKEKDEEWKAFVQAPSKLFEGLQAQFNTTMTIQTMMYGPMYNAESGKLIALNFDSDENMISPEKFGEMRGELVSKFEVDGESICQAVQTCNDAIKSLAAETGCTAGYFYMMINAAALERFPDTKMVSEENKTRIKSDFPSESANSKRPHEGDADGIQMQMSLKIGKSATPPAAETMDNDDDKKKSEEEKKEEEKAQECMVCMERPADTLVLPCLHKVACKQCSNDLTRDPNNSTLCIVCRQKIQLILTEDNKERVPEYAAPL